MRCSGHEKGQIRNTRQKVLLYKNEKLIVQPKNKNLENLLKTMLVRLRPTFCSNIISAADKLYEINKCITFFVFGQNSSSDRFWRATFSFSWVVVLDQVITRAALLPFVPICECCVFWGNCSTFSA